MRLWFPAVVLVVVGSLSGPVAWAQPNINQRMQTYTQALGIQCDYCHSGRGPGGRGLVRPEPKRDVARGMIAMTRDLNEKIQAITGKPATEATQIQCLTCHRGVPIPKQLSEVLVQTAMEKTGDAAVEQYRELRAQFYGRQAYDFGEETLLIAGQQLASRNPDAAIALLQLNLEINPKSVRGMTELAYAYTRKLDDKSAIGVLEKALLLDPENSIVKGQLDQLKSFQRLR